MSGRPRRIAIFGGSFDPVHVGHLILAEEAVARLSLDRLLFVPAARPAHKRTRALAPVAHRLAMLRLATRGNPRFRVSRLEADGGVAYTVRTLERLARREDASWTFLMGQDSLEEFATWREPGRILELARLAVVPRGGGPRPRLGAALRRRVVFLDVPTIGISSTEIRKRIRAGRSVRYWVPDRVLSYVERHGLYHARRSR
ncbi:MAG TPA: nicotinate-nucleotide adenylyltransferase [Candidatus Eisenbacteria bacterium]